MEISRRSVLTGASAMAMLPLLSHSEPRHRERGSRFVFMTDLHIQPELGAADGVALCVKKILSLNPRPDFIIVGGDAVMDLLSVSRDRADIQFKLLKEKLAPLDIPVHYAVGNHDVFGWSTTSPITRDDPAYGKAMFKEKVLEKETYYSFDHNGWHFVVLDSIMPAGERGWIAKVDDDQLDWLKKDLSTVGPHRPIVATIHVPMFTAYTMHQKGSTFPTPNTLVTENGKDVYDILRQHNTKLVLQGHTHIVEKIDYLGMQMVTGGSVSGEWWKGPRLGVHPEGFMIVDLRGNEVQTHYQPYGWQAPKTALVYNKL